MMTENNTGTVIITIMEKTMTKRMTKTMTMTMMPVSRLSRPRATQAQWTSLPQVKNNDDQDESHNKNYDDDENDDDNYDDNFRHKVRVPCSCREQGWEESAQ